MPSAPPVVEGGVITLLLSSPIAVSAAFGWVEAANPTLGSSAIVHVFAPLYTWIGRPKTPMPGPSARVQVPVALRARVERGLAKAVDALGFPQIVRVKATLIDDRFLFAHRLWLMFKAPYRFCWNGNDGVTCPPRNCRR